MTKKIAVISLIIFFILFFSEYSYNSSGNPPNGNTGAPGNGTCSGCHSGNGNPNNNSQGFLQLNFNNNNPSYLPNQSYNVTISNTGTNGANARRGFQATVLNSSNNFVGSFGMINTNTTNIETSGALTYVEHKNASISVGSWNFQWTAPAQSAGDVTFYVSTVTGNGSGSSGDFVYIDTFIIRAAPPTPPPVANFSVNKTSICVNESITFTDSSSGDITSYQWNFGTGALPATATGAGPHQVSYSSSGIKNISLTATGAGGFTTISKISLVTVNAAPNASAGNDVAVCFGNTTQLNATGGVTYLWNNGNTLSANNTANPVASPVVNTTYTVTVTDANSCSASASVTVNVNSLPNVSAGNNTSICAGESIQLNATGGVSYTWNANSTLSATNIANPIASPTSTTTYTVTATNANNCSATSQVTIAVNALPNASAGNNASICLGGTAQLNASGGSVYNWNQDATLSATNISNPIATPTVTTIYTVTVTNDNNCSAVATTTIDIASSLAVSISNDTTVCEGAAVQLISGGGNSFAWTPNAYLNNANISNPIAQPTVGNTIYSVAVSDGVCSGTASVSVTVEEAIITAISNDTVIQIAIGNTASIPLFAIGGDNYLWQPALGLNDVNSASPLFNPFDLGINNDTSFTITYTVAITKGACSNIETVNIEITINTPVGISNLFKDNFKIYPNPAINKLYIESNSNDILYIEAFDMNGAKYSFNYNNNDNSIDVSDLAQGLYYFKFIGENGTKNKIVQVQ